MSYKSIIVGVALALWQPSVAQASQIITTSWSGGLSATGSSSFDLSSYLNAGGKAYRVNSANLSFSATSLAAANIASTDTSDYVLANQSSYYDWMGTLQTTLDYERTVTNILSDNIQDAITFETFGMQVPALVGFQSSKLFNSLVYEGTVYGFDFEEIIYSNFYARQFDQMSGYWGLANGSLSLNAYLDAINSGAAIPFSWNVAPGTFQDAAVSLEFSLAEVNVAVPGVPEPATWAMMIGGFGMVGGAMRSARRRAKAIYATA
jgi:hypothetical protein